MENLLTKYPNLNNVELFTQNMNIDLFKFIPELTIDIDKQSIVSLLHYNGCYHDKFNLANKNYLESISLIDLQQLTKEEVLSLINIYYFDLKLLPCVLSIFDMDFVSGEYGRNEGINFRLIDPLYSFPEINYLGASPRGFLRSNES